MLLLINSVSIKSNAELTDLIRTLYQLQLIESEKLKKENIYLYYPDLAATLYLCNTRFFQMPMEQNKYK